MHCVGVCGEGLSSLAMALARRPGIEVTGSDSMSSSRRRAQLRDAGLKAVYSDHRASHVNAADLLLFTTMVDKDNPEMVAALQLGIPMLTRAEFLAATIESYPKSVAVVGTHGKTSTTAYFHSLLRLADIQHDCFIGGDVAEWAYGNAYFGSDELSEVLLTELTETDGHFGGSRPTNIICTSVSFDHYDAYPTEETYRNCFAGLLLDTLNAGGSVAAHEDCLLRLGLDPASPRVVSLPRSSVCASSLPFVCTEIQSFELGLTSGDVWRSKRESYLGTQFSENFALATLAAHRWFGLSPLSNIPAIDALPSVARRFQDFGGTSPRIFVDNAHHPEAFLENLGTLRRLFPDQLLSIAYKPAHGFAPYEFASALAKFEEQILVIDPSLEESEAWVREIALALSQHTDSPVTLVADDLTPPKTSHPVLFAACARPFLWESSHWFNKGLS